MTNEQIFGIIYFISYILCLCIAKLVNRTDRGSEGVILVASIIPVINSCLCIAYIIGFVIHWHINFMTKHLFKEKDNE